MIDQIKGFFGYGKGDRESPYEFEGLDPGESTQISFDKKYLSKPKEIPEEEKSFDLFIRNIGTVSGDTDYGGEGSKYKDRNEDSILVTVDPTGKSVLLSVVDGAGGSGKGLLASNLATQNIKDSFLGGKNMYEILKSANEFLVDNAEGGKATAILVKIDSQGVVSLVPAGDCRALAIRGKKKLPEGTTKVGNLAAHFNGDSTPKFFKAGNKSVPLSYLGKEEEVLLSEADSDFKPQRFQGKNGDLIILASDGVWGCISDYEIEQICLKGKNNPEIIRREIMNLAKERNNSEKSFDIDCGETGVAKDMEPNFGRGDNISVIVFELKGVPPKKMKNGSSVTSLENSHENTPVEFNRLGMLDEVKDVEWLERLQKSGQNIAVRRTKKKDGWNFDGKILSINKRNLTANISFSDGGTMYQNVPLEAIVAWQLENDSFSKVKTFHPSAEKNDLLDSFSLEIRKKEVSAAKHNNLKDFFEKIKRANEQVVLRCVDGKTGEMDWFPCAISKVDIENGILTVVRSRFKSNSKNPADRSPATIENVSLVGAYYQIKETEWRPPSE